MKDHLELEDVSICDLQSHCSLPHLRARDDFDNDAEIAYRHLGSILMMNPSRYLYYHCFDLFTALGRSLPLFLYSI